MTQYLVMDEYNDKAVIVNNLEEAVAEVQQGAKYNEFEADELQDTYQIYELGKQVHYTAVEQPAVRVEVKVGRG